MQIYLRGCIFLCYNGQKEASAVTETSRLILGLRAAGWGEKAINDFILYIELGEEQYKPKGKED